MRWAEVGIGRGGLENLLKLVFEGIPIIGFEFDHLDFEVFRNRHEHLPARDVVHERDGDSSTSKASGTADTVEVGLVIGASVVVVRDILHS